MRSYSLSGDERFVIVKLPVVKFFES